MPEYRSLTPRMITDFCRLRLNPVLDGDEASAIAEYLIGLLEILGFPPYRGKWIDWAEVAVATGVDAVRLKDARHRLQASQPGEAFVLRPDLRRMQGNVLHRRPASCELSMKTTGVLLVLIPHYDAA